MEIYNKDGVIFYVQVDHLSGEILGSVIDFLYQAGAGNVQVIPTVTKKNRPAHLFLIDAKPDCADGVERVLAEEMGVTGWHVLHTRHRHLAVDYLKRRVTFRCGGRQFQMEVEGKLAHGAEKTIRPEHRSCVALRTRLREADVNLPLTACGQILLEILRQELTEYTIA